MIARADFVPASESVPRLRSHGPALVLSQAAFWCLAALLVLGPLLFGATRTWSQSLLHLPGIALAAILAVRAWLRLREPVHVSLPGLFVAAFWGYALWHYFRAPSEIVAREELLRITLYATVFYAVLHHLPSSRHAHGLAILAIGIGAAEGLYAITQTLLGSPFIAFGVPRAFQYAGRAGGTFNCPNHFAGLLELALGPALAFGLLSRFSRPARFACLAAAALMIAGIILSISRGGWISTTLAILFFAALAAFSRRVPLWVPALAAAAVLAAGAWAFQSSDLIRARFHQMRSPQIDIRTTLYRDAIKVWRTSPATGTGPHSFQYMHPRVQQPSYQTRAVFVHGDYLHMLSDYGIAGAALAALFLGAMVLAYAIVRRSLVSRNDAALWAGCATSGVALLAHSAVDFNLHIPANAVLFFTVTTLPLAINLRPPLSIAVPRAALPAALLALAAAGAYAFGALRLGAGNAFYEKAERNRQFLGPEEVIALCYRALQIEPRHDRAAELLGDYLRGQAVRAPSPRDRHDKAMEALDYYNRARRNNPWSVQTLSKIALTHEVLRRYPEAYLLYRQALAIEPYNRTVHRMLGDHFWRRGMNDKARAQYEYVLSLFPDPKARESLNALLAPPKDASP